MHLIDQLIIVIAQISIDNDPSSTIFFKKIIYYGSKLLVCAKYEIVWHVCRAMREKDVTFKVLYCGICHSDLHMVKNKWGMSNYSLIPGYVNVNIS